MVDAIRRIKTNSGKEYAFYCEAKSTRSGFKHIVQLFVDDVLKTSNTTHYLNRTWEGYRFQSCMNGCIDNLMDEYLFDRREEYKQKHNLVRMTAKRTQAFKNELAEDKVYNEYKEVRDAILTTNFY